MDAGHPSTPQGDRRCKARNRAGQRCGAWAIHGSTVCRVHGGSAPQVKRKAALRLIELIDPAIATLGRVMVDPNAKDADKLRAAENVLDRGGLPRTQEVSSPDTAREVLIERLLNIRDAGKSRPGSRVPSITTIDEEK